MDNYKQALTDSINKHTHFSFSRSSGKGGQNVNKVNTKVSAYIAINALQGLSLNQVHQIRKKLENNINKNDELFITVQQERSQELNKKLALKLLELKILKASVIQKKRKKTTLPKKANENRLLQKKLTANLKQMRSKIW